MGTWIFHPWHAANLSQILFPRRVPSFYRAVEVSQFWSTWSSNDCFREEFLANYNLTMDQVLYNGPIYYVYYSISTSSKVKFQICDEKDVCTKPIGVWLTMLALCSCFVICLAVMGYFGTRCYYRLYQMKSELSEHTRKMQKQLLFALVIQAGIPIVIMYTPTALLLVSPIVGVSFGAYSNIAVSMVAVYPPLDQLAIIWIIRDYRNAIKRE